MADKRIVGSVAWLAVLYCSIGVTAMKIHNITAENVLRKNIFSNYDRVVIPSSRNDLLRVDLDLIINGVSLDYEKSQMTLNTWIILKWRDHRLAWDPNQYSQVDTINVAYNEIWRPDFNADNSVETNINDDRMHFDVVLGSTGSLTLVDPVWYIVHCQTDTTNWPYDTQTAELSLGSWTHTGSELNLMSSSEENEVSNKHSEWKILSVTKEKEFTLYECCPEEPFVSILYTIIVKPNVHSYQAIIYIPALCSVTFHLITFWLPHTDKHFKLFANMFNALFIALTILAMYSRIPTITSSVPLIIVYYTYSLGLISVTLAIFVAVKNMSTVSKPLPYNVTRFLHSKHLAYLGIETNNLTVDTHILIEPGESNVQTVVLNERQKLARIIDRICFIAFALIYLILLLRYIL